MSARVFNPVIMTELTRLRSSGSIDRMTQSSHSPSISAIARVRRDLFGPVDHEETRKFVEQELASQQLRDTDRWGYDFLRDMPKIGHSKYTWERISSDKVPDVYTGSRARVLHRPIPQTPVKSSTVSFLPPSITHRTSSNEHLFSHIGASPAFTVTDILNNVDNQMIVEAETTPLTEKQKVDKQTETVVNSKSHVTTTKPVSKITVATTVKTQSRITGLFSIIFFSSRIK